jgi:ABC-2 type transport system permease protein
MPRAITIARRELSGYFFSPIAYVAIMLFLLAAGVLFWGDFLPGKPAGLRTLFDWMVWLLVFVVPILSMGLLSQEWATGTIETLMTAPVEETDVVLGKFFGSLALLMVLLAPTLLYVLMIALYANSSPDAGPIFSGYLGIVLVGALFVSIGLFCSSLTRSQVVAAVSAAAILFVFTIVPYWISSIVTLPLVVRTVIDQCIYKRYTDFSRGVIDTGNLVFFVLTTVVFLFLTVKVLESRRWK